MDLRYIGRNIRFYRTEQRASQEKLAERTGLSPNYIGMIERGEKIPSVKSLLKISAELGVMPGVLLTDWDLARWKWIEKGHNKIHP